MEFGDALDPAALVRPLPLDLAPTLHMERIDRPKLRIDRRLHGRTQRRVKSARRKPAELAPVIVIKTSTPSAAKGVDDQPAGINHHHVKARPHRR